MKPSKFAYYEPSSVEQALVMLADVAEQEGRVIAGGQTLVPAMALRFAQPAYLIDINGIEALKVLEVRENTLYIGACVRHAAFHQRVTDGPLGELLSTVVRHIAHLPIRHRGTFCGSLANADPASEWCLTSVTLGATLHVRHLQQERSVPASEFFLGYMTTSLAPDELLVGVSLPLLQAQHRFGFEEISRRAGDFAQAASLAVLRLQEGVARDVRIGVGAIDSVPGLMQNAAAVMEGQVPTEALIEAAAREAAKEVSPSEVSEDGQRYQRHLTCTVVRRALQRACFQQEIRNG